jgi:hypothetical protein
MKIFAATALALLLSAAVGTAAAGPRDHGDYGDGYGQYRSHSNGHDNDVAPLLIGALLGYGVSATVHQNNYGQNGGYGNAGYYGNQASYGNQPYYGHQGYYQNQGYAVPYRVRSSYRTSAYDGNVGYYGDDNRQYRDARHEDNEYRREDRGYRNDDNGDWSERGE